MTLREEKINKMLKNRLQSLTLVAEATYLRHNLSAILRSAESFGVHDVHLVSNRKNKISGAAMGSEKWVGIHLYDNTKQCLDKLRSEGFSIWVADLHPSAKTPDTVPLDRPIALVIGTELSGVSQIAKDNADGFVVIPMQGLTQSLNVSVASACLLFRLSTRIREKNGGGDLSAERGASFKDELLKKETKQQENRKRRKEMARKAKMTSQSKAGEDPLS